jgi:hypothetical protein
MVGGVQNHIISIVLIGQMFIEGLMGVIQKLKHLKHFTSSCKNTESCLILP